MTDHHEAVHEAAATATSLPADRRTEPDDRTMDGGSASNDELFARLVRVGALVGFATFLALAVWPGRMSADTLVQIAQVRAGRYSDWHAGLLLILWRPFWLLGVGPGFVLWTAIVAFVLALYGLLRVRLSPTVAALCAVAVTVLPQVLGYVIYFGRDMWFTTFLLATCAVLACPTTRVRGHVVALGILVAVGCWLMFAARQNALPACVVLLGAMAWRFTGEHQPVGVITRRRRSIRSLALTTAALVAIVGSQAWMKRLFDVEANHIEQSIYIYDIAAISDAENEVFFSSETYPAQDLPLLKSMFDQSSFETLVYGAAPIIPYPQDAGRVARLQDQWLDVVSSHPLTYVRERTQLWLEQIAVTAPSSWVTHPGIDENQWGYEPLDRRLDRAVQRYLRWFASNDQLAGSVVHATWIYVLVLSAGLLYLRSPGPQRALGWICLACLAYQAGLFFSLMLAGYRFNLPCVVVACVVCCTAGAEVIDRHAARARSGAVLPPADVRFEPRREPPAVRAPDGSATAPEAAEGRSSS